MKGITLILLLALLMGQALGEDVKMTLGNVSIQYEVDELLNGFRVDIQKGENGGLPSFVIPLGMKGGEPELSIYPDKAPSITYIKDYLGQGTMPDNTELVEIFTGPWHINNQTGVGGYIIKANLDGKGERAIYYGKVCIFFQKGPYVCQIEDPILLKKSEKDIRNEIAAFNMSLRRFRVQLL